MLQMNLSPLDRFTEDTVACPTCNAKQPWSDVCRRCKTDLQLLHGVWQTYQQTRRRCLVHLREGRLAEALEQARQLHALCPDAHSRRLLAVCHLLRENWHEALTIAGPAFGQVETRNGDIAAPP